MKQIILTGLMIMLLITACSNTKPIPAVATVDLQRFMGDWYVIANIPTYFEKNAYNALENYQLADETTIATTFTFNADAFDGPQKTYRPTGYVVNQQNNAEWEMQFIWPFRAEYKIVYLSPDYQHTIIGRSKRDYLWIMARTPTISPEDYQQLISRATQLGYNPDHIKTVPQQALSQRNQTQGASQ